MPEVSNDNKTISKTNSGFPPYLDFDELRREAIGYLGRLSGKIWTDHNVHDPGITTLETLIYALMDLGYRSNLPAVDIFTPDPTLNSPDDNFFTPARILACNPTTILDFRKMLVDIEGVRNAWLEPATDYTIREYCDPRHLIEKFAAGNAETAENSDHECCINYINGLYHVYVDLEKKPGKDPCADEGEPDKEIISRIKELLMSHRNLCEDFIDVKVLCKQKLGVCADIEMETDADTESVYLEMIGQLLEFFSPAPRFYTLEQLLGKGKPMDEIFAGRPLDTRDSHGFLDVEEFEKITLRRNIHLSDIYSVLLNVKGIRKVQRLTLVDCQGNPIPMVKGSFTLPRLHVPEFIVSRSGFRFFRNSLPLNFDSSTFNKLFELGSGNGKRLYRYPSPNLDAEIPKGVYHDDLDHYYPLQQEFPRVYGIAEGGLADDAPPARKAKALQFKGFLLFFDQLLANYLSQLANIRSLFAIRQPDDAPQPTYFINKLKSFPDLQKLLRFSTGDDGSVGIGTPGSVMAYPVKKKELLEKIANGDIHCFDIPDFDPAPFCSADESQTAIRQFQDDINQQMAQVNYVTKNNGCVFFYITGTAEDVVLLGKKYFPDEQQAANAADTILYLGGEEGNYRNYITDSSGWHSFHIELNLNTYSNYLQQIAESEETNVQRRQAFLDHLLARFAENFSDYALLSYGFMPQDKLNETGRHHQQKFLAGYDDISSKRGKGYDYSLDGWNNGNISGFEKRFKALAGIGNWQKHSLCNFEVAEYNAKYVYALKLAGTEFFSCSTLYRTRENAQQAAMALFNEISQPLSHSIEYIAHDQQYRIRIVNKGETAYFRQRFSNREAAERVSDHLCRQFSNKVPARDIVVTGYRHGTRLQDYRGNIAREMRSLDELPETARAKGIEQIGRINDHEIWQTPTGYDTAISNLLHDPNEKTPDRFIDLAGFKIDINDTILGKPELFTYEVLDKQNHFMFRALNEFENAELARDDAQRLVSLLANDSHIVVAAAGDESRKWEIQVREGERVLAAASQLFASDTQAGLEAANIREIIHRYVYQLHVNSIPHEWQFLYHLGHDAEDSLQFKSDSIYYSHDEVYQAADQFRLTVADRIVKRSGSQVKLASRGKRKNDTATLLHVEVKNDEDYEHTKAAIEKELAVQREIQTLAATERPAGFDRFVEEDPLSKKGRYVYRLVGKDNYLAFHPRGMADKAGMSSLKDALSENAWTKYRYLQLVLRGSNTVQRKDDKTGATWHHYQLIAVNRKYNGGELLGKNLVLFESITGFPTSEAAAAAFADNYLEILEKAADVEEYGENRYISLKPLLDHSGDTCGRDAAIVFVPKDTLNELGDYDEQAVRTIAGIVKTYPVRRIRYTNTKKGGAISEWAKRFPCADPGLPEAKRCSDETIRYFYYFVLYNEESGTEDFQSTGYYYTPEDAWKAFVHFFILIRYAGNYYIDCDCRGQYQLYIREVLAESTGRFRTREDAWGKEGVQKFICVTQKENSFHAYRDEHCRYRFYVACDNLRLAHPCRYDAESERDKAIDEYYRRFRDMDQRRPFAIKYLDGEYTISNRDSKAMATLKPEQKGREAVPDCAWLELIIAASGEKNFIDTGNGYYLQYHTPDDVLLRAVPAADAGSFDEWKNFMQSIYAFYRSMLSAQTLPGTDISKWCIDLPALRKANPGAGMLMAKDCGCPDPTPEIPRHPCCDEWHTGCCYDNEKDALRYLIQVLALLYNHRNYRHVFDCPCQGYHIALHGIPEPCPDHPECLLYEQPYLGLPDENRIIAVNPNGYTDPAMACDAVERAGSLINSEGLHLVEHILLRPRCEPDANGAMDCSCGMRQPGCTSFDGCDFPAWKENTDDPCNTSEPVCFEPGDDPYSFVATVVLPAWPNRFRNKENRQWLEMMLHREAPAHVMLRILWLAPHDLCCFEDRFKQWNHWLKEDEQCYAEDADCQLVNFLTKRVMECLDECAACEPCSEKNDRPYPCSERGNANEKKAGTTFTEAVDRLYCWSSGNCRGYVYRECGEAVMETVTQPLNRLAATGENRAEIAEAAESGTGNPVQTDTISKRKFVNSRLAKYKKETDRLVAAAKGNKTFQKARRFLDNPAPSSEDFNALIHDIGQEMDKAEGKRTTISRLHKLVDFVIRNYMDKSVFGEAGVNGILESGDALLTLKEKAVDLVEIYNQWNHETVIRHEPAINLRKVQELFIS